MRSLVRFFLQVLAVWRATRRPVGLPQDLAWTERDRGTLAVFLEGPTGKRLLEQLRGKIAEANERAALSNGSASVCGQAQGMRTFFRTLEYFAAVPAQEDQPASDGLTAAGLAHLTP